MNDQKRTRSTFDIDPSLRAQLEALLTTPADDTRNRRSLTLDLWPRVMEIAKSRNKKARAWALRSLGDVGRFAPDEVTPVLSDALKSRSPSVVVAAISARQDGGEST